MHHRTTWTHLLAAVASIGLGLSLSAQGAAPAPAPAPAAKAPAKSKAEVKAEAKAKAKTKTMANAMPAQPHPRPTAAELAKMPELNSASKEQLMTLPGMTPAYADAIIKGRPYLTKANLVTKNIIPQTLYSAIHRQVKVVPPEIKR